MRILTPYFEFVARLLRPLSLCAHVGAIQGAMVGGMMGLFLLADKQWILSMTEVIEFGLILALFAWIIMMIVLCAWERYSLRAIGVPTLLLALLTSLFTVFLSNYLHMLLLDWPVGAVVGLIWGEILCRLCGL